MTDKKGALPYRALASGARGPEFESRRAYHPFHLKSITYGLSLVCRAGCDLLLLPHFPASSDKELTSNPTGGSNPARPHQDSSDLYSPGPRPGVSWDGEQSDQIMAKGTSGHTAASPENFPISAQIRPVNNLAGGGVDGDTLSRHVDDNSHSFALVANRTRRIQAAYRDEHGLGGNGSPIESVKNKPGKAGLLQPAMLRSSTMAQAGSTPARQQPEPNRDTKGRACPAGQRGVLPAARASVPSRVGAGARGATPLPSQQTVAVPGPAPDGEPGISSANR